ncbi:MAG TPA: hypothetical protein VEQ59_19145 [Polyangiaceae bacterium]|nr:hypothetical protein [Polyangiaceae bacterium]
MLKLFITLLVVGLSTACGAAAPAQHVRFADIASGVGGARIDWTKPIVLEFQAGERLPIHVAFSDQLFDLTPPAPDLAFVAKRRCFVRIDNGRITSSLTGTDFEKRPAAPGQFRFGIALTKDGSWVEVAVTTPRRN